MKQTFLAFKKLCNRVIIIHNTKVKQLKKPLYLNACQIRPNNKSDYFVIYNVYTKEIYFLKIFLAE